MGKLIITTAMTVDGVISVSEWYVAEGGHDRAALQQFDEPAAMLLGRKTFEGLAPFRSSGARASGPSRASRSGCG